MLWNWEQPDWPHFTYAPARLTGAETEFLRHGGMLLGVLKHLGVAETETLTTELLTDEALTTSAIENEVLDRASLRSSLLRQLGHQTDARRIRPAEDGVAQLVVDVLRNPLSVLSHDMLFAWHRMVMQGRSDLHSVGTYRTGNDPMQVVSGRVDRPTVHFEAPSSPRVPQEMERFVAWFNDSQTTLPAIARSGIAHLYFESIHPFEDGNGRIGRVIAEKALAQSLGQASVTMLSAELEARRSAYYEALHAASRHNDATEWLAWFAQMVIAAQKRTSAMVERTLAKAKLLEQLNGKLNARQEKALLRVLRDGPEAFSGGLSSSKYQAITRASPATAGRDLVELVELGVLRKTGSGKGTRYWLVLPQT